MKLIPQLKTKTKNSYPCKECNINIEVGEQYISVNYNDGFKKKSYGAFHKQCWNKIETLNQVI